MIAAQNLIIQVIVSALNTSIQMGRSFADRMGLLLLRGDHCSDELCRRSLIG